MKHQPDQAYGVGTEHEPVPPSPRLEYPTNHLVDGQGVTTLKAALM